MPNSWAYDECFVLLGPYLGHSFLDQLLLLMSLGTNGFLLHLVVDGQGIILLASLHGRLLLLVGAWGGVHDRKLHAVEAVELCVFISVDGATKALFLLE